MYITNEKDVDVVMTCFIILYQQLLEGLRKNPENP
jgi:hypothetical protein